MKTFKLNIGIDIKAVVPDQVIQQWRDDAKSEDATPFLRATQEQFSDDDDGFALHILKHGCRRMVRQSLRTLLEGSGIGGTLSPASAEIIDTSASINPQ